MAGGLRRARAASAAPRCRSQAGGRTAFLDGKPQERLDAYFEGLAAVCFAPDDLLLVKGGPGGAPPLPRPRRLQPLAGGARRGARVRAGAPGAERRAPHRTARGGGELPRAARPRGRAPRSCAAGARSSRSSRPRLSRRLRARSPGPGAPEARLAYRPAAGMRARGERGGARRAARRRSWRRGSSATARRATPRPGPHMDDLVLALDGRGARLYGSQGQQRALVLALKIAEIENLRAALGRPPLLLLDDVSSELDPAKNRLPPRATSRRSRRRRSSPRPTAACSSPRPARRAAFFRVENGAVAPLVS